MSPGSDRIGGFCGSLIAGPFPEAVFCSGLGRECVIPRRSTRSANVRRSDRRPTIARYAATSDYAIETTLAAGRAGDAATDPRRG